MATAVLDLDFNNFPEKVDGLDAYKRALILLRYKARPVGKIYIPVVNGTIIIADFYNDFLFESAAILSHWQVYEYLAIEEDLKINGYMPPKATIAICTRDRPQDLKKCLDALMKLPADGQEVLVIDNSPSTDETKNLVSAYDGVGYVLETSAGLNNARNRALREACNEVVVFTDDDATPDSNWLRAMLKNFRSPLVVCVTGLTMPLELETDGQEAFEAYNPFGKGFTRKVYSSHNRNPLSTGEVGAGANMALRKNVLETIGSFDAALDAGTVTQSGGDHEFFARILLAGYHIVYEPEALSWHRHRRTLLETRKAIHGYGIGVYAFWTKLFIEEGEIGILKFPWYWFSKTQFPNLMRSLLRRPGSMSFNLIATELAGCVKGPRAYLKARKKVKNSKM